MSSVKMTFSSMISAENKSFKVDLALCSRAGNNAREAVRVDEFAFAYEQCRGGKYLCNALRSQVKLCKARAATRLRPFRFSCEIWSTGSGSLKSSMLCTDKTERCSASATWRVIVMQGGVNKVSRLSCESVLALLLPRLHLSSLLCCVHSIDVRIILMIVIIVN